MAGTNNKNNPFMRLFKRASVNINSQYDSLGKELQLTPNDDELDIEFKKLIDATNGGSSSTTFSSEILGRKVEDGSTIFDMLTSDNKEVAEMVDDDTDLIKFKNIKILSHKLIELKNIIRIQSGAIVNSDIVKGTLNRTHGFDVANEDERENYIKEVERIERELKLHKHIKKSVVPNALTYGEFAAAVYPDNEIFDRAMQIQKDLKDGIIKESTIENCFNQKTLLEFVNDTEPNNLLEFVNESTCFSDNVKESEKKKIIKDNNAFLENVFSNIEVSNDADGLFFEDEGVDAIIELTNTNYFDDILNNRIDMISEGAKGKSKTNNIMKGCHIKYINRLDLKTIDILGTTLGYYYVFDPITKNGISKTNNTNIRSGSNLIYNNTFDSKTSLKDKIVTELIKSFDKKFLLQNMKFRSQIMDILDYYDITRNKLKFQFIPADRITIFKINDDEQNKGTSILDGSLYYGNLYLSLLEFTLLTYFNNGNDVKYHYVRQTGLDSRTAFNRIEEAKREIQNRSIKAHELTDATSVLSKAGAGTERFIQVGKSDIRPMETDIIQGQNVDFNSNALEWLRKSTIGTSNTAAGVLNLIDEPEFARTIMAANTNAVETTIDLQGDLNPSITKFYKMIMTICTDIPESVIDTYTWSFIQPKHINENTVSDEMLSTAIRLIDTYVALYYGNKLDDEGYAESVKKFKIALMKYLIPHLDHDKIKEIFDDAFLYVPSEQIKIDVEEVE